MSSLQDRNTEISTAAAWQDWSANNSNKQLNDNREVHSTTSTTLPKTSTSMTISRSTTVNEIEGSYNDHNNDNKDDNTLDHFGENNNSKTINNINNKTVQQLILSDPPYCFCKKPAFKIITEEFGVIYECYFMSTDTDNASSKPIVNNMYPKNDSIHSHICAFHVHYDAWEIISKQAINVNNNKKQHHHASSSSSSLLTSHIDPFNPELYTCPFFNFTFCIAFRLTNKYKKLSPPVPRCFCNLKVKINERDYKNGKRICFTCPNFYIDGAKPKCSWFLWAEELAFNKPKYPRHSLQMAEEIRSQIQEKRKQPQSIKNNEGDDNNNIYNDDRMVYKPTTSTSSSSTTNDQFALMSTPNEIGFQPFNGLSSNQTLGDISPISVQCNNSGNNNEFIGYNANYNNNNLQQQQNNTTEVQKHRLDLLSALQIGSTSDQPSTDSTHEAAPLIDNQLHYCKQQPTSSLVYNSNQQDDLSINKNDQLSPISLGSNLSINNNSNINNTDYSLHPSLYKSISTRPTTNFVFNTTELNALKSDQSSPTFLGSNLSANINNNNNNINNNENNNEHNNINNNENKNDNNNNNSSHHDHSSHLTMYKGVSTRPNKNFVPTVVMQHDDVTVSQKMSKSTLEYSGLVLQQAYESHHHSDLKDTNINNNNNNNLNTIPSTSTYKNNNNNDFHNNNTNIDVLKIWEKILHQDNKILKLEEKQRELQTLNTLLLHENSDIQTKLSKETSQRILCQQEVIHARIDNEHLSQEYDSLNEELLNVKQKQSSLNLKCQLCYNIEVQCALIPCYHSVYCLNCAQKLSHCAMCRIPVNSIQKIFLG